MYKIIGADQREYGPCSLDDLRQWHREGRLNAQTLVQAAGSTEWKPLAAYPELAALLSGAPPVLPSLTLPGAAPSTPIPAEELAQRDYDLDVLSCLNRAWALTQKNLLPVVGISFLVLAANRIVGEFVELALYPSYYQQLHDIMNNGSLSQLQATQLSMGNPWLAGMAFLIEAPVKSLLMGGLVYYYLKLIRGEDATLSDAFSGFTRAPVPLLLLGLVKALLLALGLALCVVPAIYLGVAWAFATALVIDRRLDFWNALELSRKVVSRHWFTILALIVLNAIVGIAGLLACCVGIIVTIPVALISLMYAYEDIFSRRTAG